MKKKAIVGATILGIVLSSGMTVRAADSATTPTGSAATSSPSATTGSVKGSVSSVNLDPNVMALRITDAAGKAWSIAVDQKGTTVWQAGKIASLSQIKPGDKVVVRYEQQEKTGRQIAKSIKIEPAPAAARR